MDVLEAMETRRSVRRYAADGLTDGAIDRIIQAAMSGPSAVNSRPWHFIVVRDKAILEKIPQASPYAGMAKDASVAIVVCGDPSLDKIPGFWVQDCSIAAQNILLAAHGLGYGAVWTGGYPMESQVKKLQKLFNIPESIFPLAVIPIGVPAEKNTKRKEMLAGRIHQNTW